MSNSKVIEMASLGERLVALSGEAEEEKKPEKGVWLAQHMEKFKLEKGITEDTVPTMELIKLQVCLPKIETEQDRLDYKEPISVWEDVTGKVLHSDGDFYEGKFGKS